MFFMEKAVRIHKVGVVGPYFLGLLVHHLHKGLDAAAADVVGDDLGRLVGGLHQQGV